MRGNVLTQKFIKGNGPSLGIHSGGPSPCGQRTPCKPTTQTLPQPASGKGRRREVIRGPTLSRCLPRPSATGKRPRRGRPEGLYLGGPSQHAPGLRTQPASPKRQTAARPPGPAMLQPPPAQVARRARAAHSLQHRQGLAQTHTPPRVPPPRPASRKGHERRSKEGWGDLPG